jgi:hypothetical protein
LRRGRRRKRGSEEEVDGKEGGREVVRRIYREEGRGSEEEDGEE